MNVVCDRTEPYKNTQELYEHIRAYFSRPDAIIAYDEEAGQCQYRFLNPYAINNSNALVGCAIGCAINDEDYEVHIGDLEGRGAKEIINAYDNLGAMFKNCDLDFADEAQTCHDNQTHQEDARLFLIGLDNVARKYGLKVSGKGVEGDPLD